ncbi:tripartite motif-containing protein 16-like isoform X1 [Erpetoichthys calabaricus]|uniref:tripartite motif-containing protein 16-like isoform X1 n=1 Tax=Erpetoichthys calabaricus TaxID=27687 RepID=UPI00109F6C11|nr:tripartite motif-containing protein 16-like isoform X1 [Erpetoichthys calabaricus]
MAEANISLSQDEFTCSVCLELLKDPASTACGHNFCLDCIQQYWDQNSNMGVFNCPQCRQTFSPRPVLGRNTTLVEIVERFKKTMPSHPLPENHTTPGDVPCDFCLDKTIPAVKSCLTCTASYCESHIKPHYDVLALKAHLLVNPRRNLWERICPAHQKVIDIFCKTDETSICCFCAMTEHKSHDTVISKTEREKKQSHLNMKQTEIHHRIEERLQKLTELKEGMEAFKRSAQKEIEEAEKLFTELIHSIETTCKKIIEMIKDNENAEVKKSEGVMEQLENDISALRKRSKELTELSKTDDDISFLQNYPTLTTLPGNEEFSDISFCSHFSVAALTRHKDNLKSAVEKLCNWEVQTVTQDVCVSPFYSLQPVEMKHREQFLKFFCRLKLNPRSAHRHLHLSEDLKTVSCSSEIQPYPSFPARFHHWPQVLCEEALARDCFYWEVQWSGCPEIGITYKGINRKGAGVNCRLGGNSNSWCLSHYGAGYYALHNNKPTIISAPFSPRIGIFLDYITGSLSFYSISNSMKLLHKFHATFTQPLYPAFLLQGDASVTICQ